MSFSTLRRFSRTALFSVYLLSFFYTLHVALPVYVNSTFLATLVPERFVGMIFTASSLLTIAALILIPRLLKAVGDYYTTLIFIVLEIAALIGIAAFQNPALVVALFLISSVLILLIYYDLDLIIEGLSKNAETGSVRGIYLTFQNVAWVLAPALSGFLLAGSEYWRVYIAAAALFIPALLIFALRLEHFQDPIYRRIHFREGLAAVRRNRNLCGIFLASFLLYFFFTVMVIYTPLYLHEYVGFPWEKLGVMFSIMLVPFLLLEAWLGRVADRWLGEKELLVGGFIVMAAATGVMSLVVAPSFALWAGLLFATRVGAAMVEIMIETYFFKQISGSDAQIVGLQRSLRPVAGVLGPIAATAFLAAFPMQYLFLALALVTLLGVPVSLALKDTR